MLPTSISSTGYDWDRCRTGTQGSYTAPDNAYGARQKMPRAFVGVYPDWSGTPEASLWVQILNPAKIGGGMRGHAPQARKSIEYRRRVVRHHCVERARLAKENRERSLRTLNSTSDSAQRYRVRILWRHALLTRSGAKAWHQPVLSSFPSLRRSGADEWWMCVCHLASHRVMRKEESHVALGD